MRSPWQVVFLHVSSFRSLVLPVQHSHIAWQMEHPASLAYTLPSGDAARQIFFCPFFFWEGNNCKLIRESNWTDSPSARPMLLIREPTVFVPSFIHVLTPFPSGSPFISQLPVQTSSHLFLRYSSTLNTSMNITSFLATTAVKLQCIKKPGRDFLTGPVAVGQEVMILN